MLGSFGNKFESCRGLSWKFGNLFGVYVESCKAQMRFWEDQRPQRTSLEELGLAQERLGTRIWAQHGSNLSQVGTNLRPACAQLEPTWANLGPCWVQIDSSRPSCSNYESILTPLWAYTTPDAKNDQKIIEFCCKKYQKLMLSKLPKSKKKLEN